MSNCKNIRPTPTPPIPRVVSSPRIQAVIDEDARFWEANPDVWERTRPYVPGEIKDEHGIEHPPGAAVCAASAWRGTACRVIHVMGHRKRAWMPMCRCRPQWQRIFARCKSRVVEHFRHITKRTERTMTNTEHTDTLIVPVRDPMIIDDVPRTPEEQARIMDVLRRERVVAARQLRDGRWLLAVPRMFNGGLLVDRNVDDGMFEEEYSYQALDEAMIALIVWDPDTDADPSGWVRHIPSYRRRPGGDATKEEVRE